MNTQEKIKVLYLDDELHNLTGFKASLRFDYTIFIATTIPQAYEHLEAHPDISIVLCDQRMPNKTGADFFAEIRDIYPKPVRMLITAFADIEDVIDAVNRGHIFRYIKKPWTDADMKSAIGEANKFYIANSLLASRTAELQAAYDELGKFAYTITHDVRGPLLSVMGALNIAKSIDSMTELRELLDMMQDALKKLDEFIKNTHEYYNLKKGRLIYEEIDFNKLVNDSSALFRISGKMNKIRFTANVSQIDVFKSDEIAIKIIVNNLLSNAFKYQRKNAEDKFVEMGIDIVNNNVTIFVKDNGIGIHENHLTNIFGLFYRATSEESGSGFGLYNVKDALNKLNGTIEVSSILNEGTTFKVIIPGKANGAK